MGALRNRIERLMRDGGSGGGLGLLLLALSFVYGAGVRMRNTLYAMGLRKTRRLPCKVISVGNITAGGSGKTPIAMHIARVLQEHGAKVAILSRGYKRKTGGAVLTVSTGQKMLLKPDEAGDEPFLMAERLKGVPVVVGADRVEAGMTAVKKFSPDVVVLDDGFQHLRLARDLNILLVDSSIGFGSGRLLPRGVLREPLRGINRADLAMVKGGKLRERDSDRLKRFKLQAVAFRYRPTGVFSLADGGAVGLEFLRRRRVVALAGTADPESFFTALEGLGARVVRRLPYPDHHFYTRADVEVIKKAVAAASKAASTGESGAEPPVLVTTEKDGVKLRRYAREEALPPVYALAIDVEMEDSDAFEGFLKPFFKK